MSHVDSFSSPRGPKGRTRLAVGLLLHARSSVVGLRRLLEPRLVELRLLAAARVRVLVLLRRVTLRRTVVAESE